MVAMQNAKVYLAARFSLQAELRKYRDDLLRHGIECTSRWLDENETVKNGMDDSDVVDSVLAKYALRDLEDIQAARTIVFWSEPPRTPTRGGRIFELGYAHALGKRCIFVGENEFIFHHLPDLVRASNWGVALSYLKNPIKFGLRQAVQRITHGLGAVLG